MKSLENFKSQKLEFASNVYGGNNGTSSTSQCTTENNDCRQVDCVDDCNGDNLTCVETSC